MLLTYLYGSGASGKKVRNVANKFGNLCGLWLVLFTSLTPEEGRIIITDREPVFYYAPIMPMLFGLLLSNIISMLIVDATETTGMYHCVDRVCVSEYGYCHDVLFGTVHRG